MTIPDAKFSFHHSMEVRFRDVDVGGHAHHSQALVYFEEARAAYWRDVVGRAGVDDIDYILAEAEVRYHARVFWPSRLRVGVRVSRMGKKHFEMQYAVTGAEDQTLVSGRTVQIMYDYATGSTQRIPDDVRARIDARDGPV